MNYLTKITVQLAGGIALIANLAQAGEPSDDPQWCGRADRNRIAAATGLANSFEEISTNATEHAHLRNVKWLLHEARRRRKTLHLLHVQLHLPRHATRKLPDHAG